ncbi:MAG: N-acetyl-gamma-glutamyl-phosphate reductase [Ruminococcaceae bacterium]|nr:N-acetyl-gamma-glutamyl-phosphate reductase [Oscillospiraceae bacterium]
MKRKIFIDGQEGTTGLQIFDRLSVRDDIELLIIDEVKRKDPDARKTLMDEADLVFLCLPDHAAIEAVKLIETAKIIDASTAHRINEDWVYGFSELSDQHKERIIKAKKLANPGCHSTGVISILYPLIKLGIISKEGLYSAISLTGYSGGGKKMIADYKENAENLMSPRQYGLSQNHKHIPEIQKICDLAVTPIFIPIVDDFYKGMQTSVPLHKEQTNGFTAQQICDQLYDYYKNTKLISVNPKVQTEGMLATDTFKSKDTLEITVSGNDDRIVITARFDNLGKGASGAAVQNMNLMLGFDETKGLNI